MLHPDISSRRTSARGFHPLGGVFLIVSSLGIGVVGWLALSILADNMQKNPDVVRDVAPLARQIIGQRGWFPLLVTPAFIVGILLLLGRHPSRAGRWLLVVMTTLWLAALFAAVLYSFLMFIMPMYQYQPI